MRLERRNQGLEFDVSKAAPAATWGSREPAGPGGGSRTAGGLRLSDLCIRISDTFCRGVSAGYACTAYNSCMQYTIRGIPVAVDNALRERARMAGKSLNEAAVDALAEGSGMTGSRRKRRDLADIAKTWKADKAVEAALADQDRVDEDLWR